MRVWSPVFVPAVLAGLFFLVSWRAWRRKSPHAHGHWGGAVAFGAAYFAAHVLILSWPAFPPAAAAEWQAWLAIALGMLGAAQRWWGVRWYLAWPVRATISAGMCLAILQSPLHNTWGRAEGEAWIAGLAAALIISWESLEQLAKRRAGASLPLSLWTYCAASAGVFVVAGSGALAQLTGGLAAAAGAAIVLAWWAPGIALNGGALTAFVPLSAGLLMRSYFLGEMSMWAGGLLYLAPFALWFGERRRHIFSRPWKAALVRAALIGVPSLVALGVEWWLSSRGGEAGY